VGRKRDRGAMGKERLPRSPPPAPPHGAVLPWLSLGMLLLAWMGWAELNSQ
jgi:hypothetical protein